MGERRGLKALELWCKRVTEGYPGVKIDNMTTSWRDGLAFCAIINHFRPDLIDFGKLNKDDVFRNNELAFSVAQQYLGIPALLDAEDMVEYAVPDRLSILTYLSQFYNALACNPGNSPPRTAPKRQAPAAERNIVLPASTSPPAKMAIRSSGAPVEMPRREPCVRCERPVFLVERVLVGKQLYHAACFRCARCAQPMSAGNYYEMEGGGFCCETCPNEERDASDATSAVPVRSVLERSLSDEEKSYRTVPAASTPFATDVETHSVSGYTTARSHFMKDLIAREEPEPEDSDSCLLITDTNSCSASASANASRTVNISDIRGGLPAMDVRVSVDSVSTKEDRRLEAADAISLSEESAIVISEDSDANSTCNSAATQSPPPPSKRHSKLPRWPPILTIDLNSSSNDDSKDSKAEEEEAGKTYVIPSGRPPQPPQPSQVVEEHTSSSPVTKEEVSSSNPFDDDEGGDEDEDVGNPSASSTRLDQSQKSLNPFSDDEDDEDDDSNHESLDNLKVKPLRKVFPRLSDYKLTTGSMGDTPEDCKVLQYKRESILPAYDSPKSLNPFSSDEDDDEDVDVKQDKPLRKVFPRLSDYKLTTGSAGDTPEECKVLQYKRESILPTYETPDYRRKPPPRISMNPFSSDEEDDTSMGSAAQKRSTYGSTNSLASTASSSVNSTYRKKKPAPKPPIPEFALPAHAHANSTGSSPVASIASSPSTSAQHSPKPRKSKRAPLPPMPPTSTPAGVGPIPAPRVVNLSSIPHVKPDASYEKAKVAKDEANRQTQSSQFLLPTRDKSTYGKWKRKKGQAPGLPVPQKRTIKALPMTELKKELDIIDVQLQGLNKQGVRLEKIIRDQCEGPDADPAATRIPIEAEDLILQLFEVVNEKNELCRRQSELMYLKRQHRLEEEQADIEYQVRCLMLQSCKTDSEKTRETELIERLVEVVNMRAEIVECLEMDRVRGVEEDDSISSSMNTYASKRDGGAEASPAKKEKKKKFRKLLKFKKLTMNRLDADKDVDESETHHSSSSSKSSKSKKKK